MSYVISQLFVQHWNDKYPANKVTCVFSAQPVFRDAAGRVSNNASLAYEFYKSGFQQHTETTAEQPVCATIHLPPTGYRENPGMDMGTWWEEYTASDYQYNLVRELRAKNIPFILA